jgi:phosphoadenosine phosphosulfate reductase
MLTPAEVRERAAALRGASAEAILGWAVAAFPRRAALTVSFGGAGVVLAHMLSRLDKTVPIFFLDTGFHFPETLAFRAGFAAEYGLNVVDLRPREDPGPLYRTDPDRCCWIRKVEPLRGVLPGFDAWVSAVRSEQGAGRGRTEVLEYHEADGHAVVKVHPLASWSKDDVRRYIGAHQVPYHPLLDAGYTSIGCWPCTRPTAPGEDERAGRWSGTGKTECGLHTFTARR